MCYNLTRLIRHCENCKLRSIKSCSGLRPKFKKSYDGVNYSLDE